MAGVCSEVCFLSATEMLELLDLREVSSVELVRAMIDRIESVNPKINAIVTLAAERALQEAEASDRRRARNSKRQRALEGLPVTIKDTIATAGLRSTDGTRRLQDYVPEHDALAVARMRAAGAVVIGKTNVPELGLDLDCDNPLFGPTRNPWDLSRVPGGSSGGEAAALAAGMAPLGLGSDYAGSIRVPSHFCGVAGLRPTCFTVPFNGHLPPSFTFSPPILAMATIGPMARQVADLALAYDVIRGTAPDAPSTIPSRRAQPISRELKGLRVALFKHGGPVPVQPEIVQALDRAAGALAARGLHVEESHPPVERAYDIFFRYRQSDGAVGLKGWLGEEVQACRSQFRERLAQWRPEISASQVFAIAMERDRFRAQLAEFMARFPIILTPAFCTTAFPLGCAQRVETAIGVVDAYEADWPNIWMGCAGIPSAVVPAGSDERSLPIGVQLVGRPFEEGSVLAVAQAIEEELGGYREPPI